MHLGYMIIYVESVEKTLEFYSQAFGCTIKFLDDSKMYGELDTGQTTLAFASHEMGEMHLKEGYISSDLKEKPLGIEIAFVFENVKKAYEKACEAGAIAIQAPQKKPWGQTVSYVRSIEGTLVEICSPVMSQ